MSDDEDELPLQRSNYRSTTDKEAFVFDGPLAVTSLDLPRNSLFPCLLSCTVFDR